MEDRSRGSGEVELARRQKQNNPNPVLSPQRRLLVMVMGATGTGKSTLVSRITKQPVVIGNSLRSCTTTTSGWDFDYNTNLRVTLADTPGFGDSSRSDFEILEDIIKFLSEPRRPPLTGIIFCHKITETRVTGSLRQTIRILFEICGRRFCPHVVFATTMWDTIPPDSDKTKYLSRESELQRSDVGWREFTDSHASTEQYLGDTASAMRILDQVLFHRPPLRILEQLDRGKMLEETDAGRSITEELRKLAEKRRREEQEELHETERERDRLRDQYQQASATSRPPRPSSSQPPTRAPNPQQSRSHQSDPPPKERNSSK